MSQPIPPSPMHVPDWDENHPDVRFGKTTLASTHSEVVNVKHNETRSSKVDAWFPPHRTFLGMQRRIFCIVLGCIIAALLALTIGLAAGLATHQTSHLPSPDNPLPANSTRHVGDLTYYAPGLGACGITSSGSDMIVAISHFIFDAASTSQNPNNNPLCGRTIVAERFDEQVGSTRSISLEVVDRCVGCAANDLDVSPSAFESLAPLASGRVNVTWAWLSATATPSS